MNVEGAGAAHLVDGPAELAELCGRRLDPAERAHRDLAAGPQRGSGRPTHMAVSAEHQTLSRATLTRARVQCSLQL